MARDDQLTLFRLRECQYLQRTASNAGPRRREGGTGRGWRLTFLFVILKQPCGAKGEYLSRNAQRFLKSSSEQFEDWQLHAQALPICGDRLEEVLTSSRNERGTHSEEPMVGEPASTSGRINAVKIYCPAFLLHFSSKAFISTTINMSSLMNVSRFPVPQFGIYIWI
jgi:hypothetical protein